MTLINQHASPHISYATGKFSWLVAKTNRWFSEFLNRKRLKVSVGKLSAKNLRDIGLTENDLTSAQNSALSISGAELLREARKNSAGNW